MFDLDLGDHLREKRDMSPEKKAEVKVALAKARKQLTKDFVLYPALSGRAWKSTLAANATANPAAFHSGPLSLSTQRIDWPFPRQSSSPICGCWPTPSGCM